MPKPVEDPFFADYAPVKKTARKSRKSAMPSRPMETTKAPLLQAEPEPEKEVEFQAREKVRDWTFEEAVKALEPILHPATKVEYAYILDPYYDNEELRAHVEDWRERHGFME